ncbi:hypothetical protein BDP27DRAFT_1366934 [Rhodocollybia butyracea]|uniref:Uncharacterized protein n=1 Tax=Rhodocollybia butyracea TaxID=206335 RepID=A0A9P5U3D7_9AGAR|nr:hypothetical protein BDP27DRAFT_1366934 [Rhodocollybia butyracea]
MTPILLQVVPEGIVPTLIMVRTLLGLGVGGSPHRSVEAEAEVDGDLEPPTLRYTDVKRKWSNATSSFPSESAASPSRYTYVHDDLHGTLVCGPLEIPAYHCERESDTGYQSEKQQIELRYEPQEASVPTTSVGTVKPPSSSSKQQHFDIKKLQPLRYSTEQRIDIGPKDQKRYSLGNRFAITWYLGGQKKTI